MSIFKQIAWTLAVLSLCSGQSLANDQPALSLTAAKGKPRIDLSADRLSYRPDKRLIVLEGKVILGSARLRVRAARVTVRVDKKGNPVRVIAKGNVSFSLGKSKGRAGSLEVMPQTGKVELSGNPTLRWAPLGLDLRGQRILLDLARDTFTVHRAKVRMGAGKGDAPGQAAKGAGR